MCISAGKIGSSSQVNQTFSCLEARVVLEMKHQTISFHENCSKLGLVINGIGRYSFSLWLWAVFRTISHVCCSTERTFRSTASPDSVCFPNAAGVELIRRGLLHPSGSIYSVRIRVGLSMQEIRNCWFTSIMHDELFG